MTATDFTDNELQLVNQVLLERYNRIVPLQSVEVELLLQPGDAQPVPCPALYWSELDAEFVVAKTGDQTFRCQFFYSPDEIFGTGRETYDNLGDCVVTLLRLQADHHGTRSGALPEGAKQQGAEGGDDYFPPIVI
ncbi:MAG: hypothetical protein HZB40_04350 [Rhodocyclales bacterium]|nr:hypothetical protein [Rhodocyclales bacterium]